MKKALLIASLLGISISAQAAPIYNAGTGHWYEYVYVQQGVDWNTANTAANAASYLGLAGHLVTVTSSAENQWIVSNLLDPNSDPGYGAWMGLYQPVGSAEPGGDWSWVTGEAFSYANWLVGEPNDLNGENVGHFWAIGTDGRTWNDLDSNDLVNSYVIEYEARSVADGGTTAALLGLVLVGLAALRHKLKLQAN